MTKFTEDQVATLIIEAIYKHKDFKKVKRGASTIYEINLTQLFHDLANVEDFELNYLPKAFIYELNITDKLWLEIDLKAVAYNKHESENMRCVSEDILWDFIRNINSEYLHNFTDKLNVAARDLENCKISSHT